MQKNTPSDCFTCKSIITTKEALLRLTVFWFSGQTDFQWECYRLFKDSITISVIKTLRRLDTTWSFAASITRVSTHEHQHWEHCLWTGFTKKKVFGQLACSTRRRPASWEVLISECDLSWTRVEMERSRPPATTIHARSHVTSTSILFLTSNKTTNYLCIYMELSFRSVPP